MQLFVYVFPLDKSNVSCCVCADNKDIFPMADKSEADALLEGLILTPPPPADLESRFRMAEALIDPADRPRAALSEGRATACSSAWRAAAAVIPIGRWRTGGSWLTNILLLINAALALSVLLAGMARMAARADDEKAYLWVFNHSTGEYLRVGEYADWDACGAVAGAAKASAALYGLEYSCGWENPPGVDR